MTGSEQLWRAGIHTLRHGSYRLSPCTVAYGAMFAIDMGSGHVVLFASLNGRIAWIFFVHATVKPHTCKFLFERHVGSSGSDRSIPKTEISVDGNGDDNQADNQAK